MPGKNSLGEMVVKTMARIGILGRWVVGLKAQRKV